ncbi:MAG: PKD domain-containing protein, partial [Saprospiraceae bacterium]
MVQNDMMGVQFTDLSVGTPTNWLWGFGDGNTSNEQNPFYVYDSVGTYNICLLIQDTVNNCNASFCESLTILPTSTQEILIKNRDLLIYPNPAQQYLSKWTVEGILENDFYRELDLKIYDVHGRTLLQQQVTGDSKLQIDIPNALTRGLYMLEIRGDGNVYRGKVVVE